jgi:N-acetylglucosaminyl-diphospho-decaprenol L-rhamnosyltransferase
MDLSIIIVNWNSAHFARKCIASIQSAITGLQFEVIVVDNGSGDGCEDMLRSNFPDAIFVESHHNLGFARANNLGFRHSRGKCLAFLNPDTEVLEGALNVLHQSIMTLNDAGAVGAKLINSDGTLQTSCIQAFPTITNQLLDSELLRNFFPRLGLWGMKPLFSDSQSPTEVDAISGACLLIKRDVFESIGYFSEDYFMYSEDVDLCYKCHSMGLKNYYVPGATVIHHSGGSTSANKGSEVFDALLSESRWRYFKQTRGVGYAALYRGGIALTAGVRLWLITLLWLLSTLVRRTGSFSEQLKKWIVIFKWAIGLEQRVRNYAP